MESHRITHRGSPDTSSSRCLLRDVCAKDVFRIEFGVIWLIDGFFKWRPGFHKDFVDMVNSAGHGQPTWLHWFFRFTHDVITPYPHVWGYGIATLETLIGLALIPVRAKPFVTQMRRGRLPTTSCRHAHADGPEDRAAATLPPAGSPHQTSCRRPRSQPEGRRPK
jgi:hypothetical protein